MSKENTEEVGMYDELKAEIATEEKEKSEAERSEPTGDEEKFEKTEDSETNGDDEKAEDGSTNSDENTEGKVYTDADFDAVVEKKIQKKINKMTRRQKESEEANQRLGDEITKLKGKLQPKEEVKTLESFNGDVDKYTDYLLDLKLDKRVADAKAENSKAAKVQQARDSVRESREQSFEELTKVLPDASEVISGATDITLTADVLNDLDEMGDVAGMLYMFAKNPNEAEKANGASEKGRLLILAKLDLKLEQLKSKAANSKKSDVDDKKDEKTETDTETDDSGDAITPVGDVLRGASGASTTPAETAEDRSINKYMAKNGFS